MCFSTTKAKHNNGAHHFGKIPLNPLIHHGGDNVVIFFFQIDQKKEDFVIFARFEVERRLNILNRDKLLNV